MEKHESIEEQLKKIRELRSKTELEPETKKVLERFSVAIGGLALFGFIVLPFLLFIGGLGVALHFIIKYW